MKDLSWITKWSIRRRVKQDLAGNGITRAVSVADSAIPGADLSGLPATFTSSYISEQFGKYSYYKEHQLFPKKHRYWLYNSRMEPEKKRGTLSEAITAIQSQISELKMELSSMAEQDDLKMKNLETEKRKYELSREFHMVQMCVNHALKLREDFAKRTLPIKKAIHKLYAQLANLLEREKTISLKERSKIYRRIRYYCGYACQLNAALGAEYIKDDVMALMGDTDPLNKFSIELEDAIAQRDYYLEELGDAEVEDDEF